MSTSDKIALIAVAFTLISIIYTISVDIRNRRIAKTQDALNLKLLAKEIDEEKKKTKVEVNGTFFKGFNNNWTLKIYNKGTAVARNVSWEYIGEDPGWMYHNNIFPMEFMNPGQSIDINVSVFFGSSNSAKIKITWEDDSSKENTWESLIAI